MKLFELLTIKEVEKFYNWVQNEFIFYIYMELDFENLPITVQAKIKEIKGKEVFVNV